MHPQRIGRERQRQRPHVGLIAIDGQDRRLPGVLEFLVGQREVKEPPRPDVRHVPDPGLARPHRQLRVELAVDSLLPAGHEAVARPQGSQLAILNVDLREGKGVLPIDALVLRPGIEGITDLDRAGETAIDLHVGAHVVMGVIPVHAGRLRGGRHRNHHLHRLARTEAAVDVVPLAHRGHVAAVEMEVCGEFVRVQIGAQVVGDRQLERVARIELQGRTWKGGRIALAVGIKLIGHRGQQLARGVIGRGAGEELLRSIQNRVAVGARAHKPHARLEDAVLAGDDGRLLEWLQLIGINRDVGNQQILSRKEIPPLEVFQAQRIPPAAAARDRPGPAGGSAVAVEQPAEWPAS